MADDAQDRQLPATARKIEKARADGQVPRSRDLGHLAALATGVALLAALAPRWTAWAGQLLSDGLRFDAQLLARPGSMSERLAEMALQMLIGIVPLGAVIAAVSVAAAVLSGGWNFTLKPLSPQLGKLGPIAGLQRMLSPTHLAEMAKACLLAVLLGAVGLTYLHAQIGSFSTLTSQPLPAALASAGALVQGGLTLLLLVLVVFALVDVPLQRHLLAKRLRMSFEELKKEHKDVEGNTEVKAKIRLRMREMANRRMLAAVPKADLVVMNPTHFAVALKYDEAAMAAPRVVAKGADLMAFRIRDAAQKAQVPVLQAPPLARALYAHAEVDQEIPAALFGAVAQVLAWVYQLRGSMAAGRAMPPPEVEVPAGLDPGAPKPVPEA